MHLVDREHDAGADVVAEHDRSQHRFAGQPVALADRERGRYHARARVRARWRMRVVGLVGMR
jgi:hypothetical protein